MKGAMEMSTIQQPPGFGYEGIRCFCRMPICFELNKLEADVAVVGICFDTANYDRCGSRYGPQAIREASMELGITYHPQNGFYDSEQRKHILSGVRIVDCGDVTVFPTLPYLCSGLMVIRQSLASSAITCSLSVVM